MTDHEILVAGETLIDCIPTSSESLETAETFERRAGGAPANVAVRLAQLDETPLFWTRLAQDAFGEFLAATVAEHGLPETFLQRDPDAKTTLAFVGNSDGEQEFTFYRDGTADTRMRAGTVPDDRLQAVEWVYTGGVALAAEPARSAILDLLDRAQAHDCTVVFDPNARPELWRPGEFERVLARALRAVDIVTATPDDLHEAGLAGDGNDLAASLFERGPHTLFLTRGERGATAYASETAPWLNAPSTGVSHEGYSVGVVDPTGAGDAFVASVLSALAEGVDDLAELLAVGNALGAMATAGVGATSELPHGGDVTAFRDARE